MNPCQECLAELLNKVVVLGLINMEAIKQLRHLEKVILEKAKEGEKGEDHQLAKG